MVTTAGFARRVNQDSTTDSICLSCFKPVSRAANEFELANEEKLHKCEPLELRNAVQVDFQRWHAVSCRRELL